jgi:hypothetical protein
MKGACALAHFAYPCRYSRSGVPRWSVNLQNWHCSLEIRDHFDPVTIHIHHFAPQARIVAVRLYECII